MARTSWLHDSNLVILDVKVCQMNIPGNTSSPSLNHTGCVLIKLYFWSVSSLNPTRLFLIFSPTHAFETNYPEAASRAFFLLPLPYPTPLFFFFEGGRKRVIVMFVIFQSLTICPVRWQYLKISGRPMFISVISGLCLLFFYPSPITESPLINVRDTLVLRSSVSPWTASDLPQYLWGGWLISSSKYSWRLPLKTRERRKTGEQHSRAVEPLT